MAESLAPDGMHVGLGQVVEGEGVVRREGAHTKAHGGAEGGGRCRRSGG